MISSHFSISVALLYPVEGILAVLPSVIRCDEGMTHHSKKGSMLTNKSHIP
jgi:hypothetical protein